RHGGRPGLRSRPLAAPAPLGGPPGRNGGPPAGRGPVLAAAPPGPILPATRSPSAGPESPGRDSGQGAGARARTRTTWARAAGRSQSPSVPGAGLPGRPDLRPEGRRATPDRRQADDPLRPTPGPPRVALLVRYRGEAHRARTRRGELGGLQGPLDLSTP